MNRLSDDEIRSRLGKLAGWSLTPDGIRRTFDFPDFMRAMAFVNAVAGVAEARRHHPDIDIRYNKVTLTSISHDAAGLTERDFALAEAIDGLHRERPGA